MHDMTNEV